MNNDKALERVARAIANSRWDKACTALGTPNYPRGGDWTACLPEARAAIEAMGASDRVEPFAWEATTPAYTRWITDSRYQRLKPYARKWYRPFCQRCAALSETSNVEPPTTYLGNEPLHATRVP